VSSNEPIDQCGNQREACFSPNYQDGSMAVAEIPSGIAFLESQFDRDGWVIFRQLFTPAEMQVLQAEAERLYSLAEYIHPRNLRCRFMPHHETGEQLFEVFDPVNDISPICESMSKDPRIFSILKQLYGEPACLFKDKLIFKPSGAMGYRLHQDIPLGWKGFPRSFVTVLLPIDSPSPENGCTEVYSGYHDRFLSDDPAEYTLPDHVVDPARRVDLILEPGDIAIFHGLTPHRSAPNRTGNMRRTLYVSYNSMSDGGDQREAHYAEFQEMMRKRLLSQSNEPVFFR
jgi:hypothetical protein